MIQLNRETSSGFNIVGVTPCALFTRFGTTAIFTSFGPPKDSLHGCHFRSYGVVKEAMHNWLAQQPNDFFSRRIYAQVEHWRRCVKRTGGYTED
jgi:hypothetical protein